MAKCPNCGNHNKITAKFCENCGTALNDVNTKSRQDKEVEGPSRGFRGFWNRQSSGGKAVTGVAACCLGVFLLVVVVGLLSPGITALSVGNISIDNVTTNLTINGTSEPNATINITAADLNINNATVKAGPDGKFKYVLKIPVNVTDTKVTVSAQNKDRYVNSEEITIQRPVTPLTADQIPEINNNTKNVTVEGNSDPQAVITVNSDELNIHNLVIHPDSKGHYKQVIQVPLNTTSASISLTAKSVGKRESNIFTIYITRAVPQPEPQPATQQTTQTAPTDTATHNTGSSSSSSGSSGSYSSTGSSSSSSAGSGAYIGNARSHIFHYASCYHVDAMKDSNKVYFSSAKAAEDAGYRPCKDCNP